MPPRKKAKRNQDVEHVEEQPSEDVIRPSIADPEASTDPTGDEDEDSSITHSSIPFGDKPITFEAQGHRDALAPLIFTHGAGGGIDSPACRDFARGYSQRSPILSFQGSMNLKNRIKAFHTVLEYATSTTHSKHGGLALGGRSMGARAAVLVALEMEEPPGALVLVSYPLAAGSRGEKREPERREQILLDLPGSVDVLFVIGGEDTMCDLATLSELRGRMVARSWLCVVKGADHGMGLRPKSAAKRVRRKTGEVAALWMRAREEGMRRSEIWWDENGDGEGHVLGGEWGVES